jgi:uncharacterized membrane protein YhaH (DUF805 family)
MMNLYCEISRRAVSVDRYRGESPPEGPNSMNASFYRSSKGRLLFALGGRIHRADFWVGLVAVLGITTLAILLHGKRLSGGALVEFLTIITIIAVLSPYCLTAVVVKRLHDLDKSGWHALVLFVAFLLSGLAAMAHEGLQQNRITVAEWRDFWSTAFYVSAGLAFALLAYLIVRLGFAQGTLGSNRFGPDPAAPVEELAAEKAA